jgi:hypothetical protein
MARNWGNPVTSASPIRATHVSVIRSAIDEDKALVPAPYRYNFSWSNVVSGDRILAKHFTEMRSAIQLLWDFKSRGSMPGWSGPSAPAVGAVIRASHVTDLRTWLNQYEDNHAPFQQGIDSKSYDPSDSRLPIIQDQPRGQTPNIWDWPADVHNLGPVKGLYVRTNIVAPGAELGRDELTATQIQSYNTAFARYVEHRSGFADIQVYPVLSREFANPAFDPRAPLVNRTNEFIEEFSRRVSIVTNPAGGFTNVAAFIIWNEPNVNASDLTGTYLPETHFAALMRRCRERSPSSVPLYCGGLQFGPDFDPNPADYMDKVYDWFNTEGLRPDPSFTYPWVGINIHLHNKDRTTEQVAADFADIREAKSNAGDDGELIVGEWGITQESFSADATRLTDLYSDIRANAPDVMFFHAHHGLRDGPNPNLNWGLRVRSDAMVENGKFKLMPEYIGGSGNFYTTFKTLVNS